MVSLICQYSLTVAIKTNVLPGRSSLPYLAMPTLSGRIQPLSNFYVSGLVESRFAFSTPTIDFGSLHAQSSRLHRGCTFNNVPEAISKHGSSFLKSLSIVTYCVTSFGKL